MIQKTLVFVVDFTGKMIDGEKPVGFLRANDKNKNTIFLITPEQPTTQIKARFLAKTKHNDGVAVNGILTTDYKVNDLVSETKSYYEKIKDWNVFYFPVPERVVNYIASNAGGEIGITFEFVEWQLPRIKDIYGDFLGEITDRSFLIDANEDGYYVNRVIDYEYNGDKYGYNDLFIVGGGTITAIRAFPRTGGAVGGYFGVDPMYDSGVFEYVDGDDIDPSITTQIKNQVNNLTSEVYFLNVDNEKNKTDIATLKTQVSDINVDIVDLDNRVNDNASDIIDLGDDLVKTIKSTCANKLDLVYSSINNRIAITLKSYDGTTIDADLIDLPKATTTSDGLMSKEDKVFVNGLPSALLLKENKSEKGIANGYASLDGSAKIPTSQLPDSILGQLEYKGTFNPSSGYPVSPEKGWFYIAIANALISGVDYKVGDWAVYNGVSWDKVDNTDAVASVNGKLGAVILYGTEIQVGNGDTWTVEQRIVDIYAELSGKVDKTTKVNKKALTGDIELTSADIIDTYTTKPISQAIEDLFELCDFSISLSGYVVATDDDFIVKDVRNRYFKYIGTDEYIIVPKMIQGYQVTNLRSETYAGMFKDVSNVKGVVTASELSDFDFAFGGCESILLDLRYLHTSQATAMTAMFWKCPKLTSLDVSNFDTSQVIYMNAMFKDCINLTSLDLSNFDTSKVTDMHDMFMYSSKLRSLDISNFTHESVTDKSNMFKRVENCTVYFKDQDEIDYFTTGTEWSSSNTAVIKGA